jgi:hypothetical protein
MMDCELQDNRLGSGKLHATKLNWLGFSEDGCASPFQYVIIVV